MSIKQLKKEIIKTIISSKEVYLAGHTNIDLDAFAAMAGFSLIAEKLKKSCYFIIDDLEVEKATKLAIEKVSSDIKIVSSKDVYSKNLSKATLFVFDVNKPNMMTDVNLTDKFIKTVIIDHHNVTKETYNSPYLYVDKKATSTCEIVSELLYSLKVKVPKEYATILLGGIALDTNNFTYKMTKKSFYYCYYLAKKGGDVAEAQLFLKQDLEEYVKRSKMIANTKIENEIAIAKGERGKIYTPQELAKTADLLLSFKGIKNAFAIGHINKKTIGISARSLNKVNAGNLMENFGGGGNANEAAAKVEKLSIKEIEKEILTELV